MSEPPMTTADPEGRRPRLRRDGRRHRRARRQRRRAGRAARHRAGRAPADRNALASGAIERMLKTEAGAAHVGERGRS